MIESAIKVIYESCTDYVTIDAIFIHLLNASHFYLSYPHQTQILNCVSVKNQNVKKHSIIQHKYHSIMRDMKETNNLGKKLRLQVAALV